jgi:hypothetical protein
MAIRDCALTWRDLEVMGLAIPKIQKKKEVFSVAFYRALGNRSSKYPTRTDEISIAPRHVPIHGIDN